jgi:hypothetical protein
MVGLSKMLPVQQGVDWITLYWQARRQKKTARLVGRRSLSGGLVSASNGLLTQSAGRRKAKKVTVKCKTESAHSVESIAKQSIGQVVMEPDGVSCASHLQFNSPATLKRISQTARTPVFAPRPP